MNFMKKVSERSIRSNPIEWSRTFAKSPGRMIIVLCVHFVVVIFWLWAIYHWTAVAQSTFSDSNIRNHWEICAVTIGGIWMIACGVMAPGFYLYALYRLLREIDKREKIS